MRPVDRGKSLDPGESRDLAPALEIAAASHHPLGMPVVDFLRDYWQKRPLLIRQAFADFESPISPDDLAGLACEELAPSRLVLCDPVTDAWSVEHGPFAETRFQSVPNSHWTLLVQDCDKLLAEVDDILSHFSFVPGWRLDDVMISYAVDGGSVGAHLDQYDVFLLQATGQRRWDISTDPHASNALRADVELKLLSDFRPTHSFVLQPGDMLYLPPGVPHHGVSIGECTTWSIGMRAPSRAELLVDFAEFLAEKLDAADRYADPDLQAQPIRAEIVPAVIDRMTELLGESFKLDAGLVGEWFPRFITRYRAAHDPAPAARPLDAKSLLQRLGRGNALFRSPWSRVALVRCGEAADLVVAGESHRMTLAGAQLVAESKCYSATAVAALDEADRATLAVLHNQGHLVLARA